MMKVAFIAGLLNWTIFVLRTQLEHAVFALLPFGRPPTSQRQIKLRKKTIHGAKRGEICNYNPTLSNTAQKTGAVRVHETESLILIV